MGDDEADSSGQHCRESFLDSSFGLGVYGAGGFVHHEDSRVGQHGACKADQLLLPGGQRTTIARIVTYDVILAAVAVTPSFLSMSRTGTESPGLTNVSPVKIEKS